MDAATEKHLRNWLDTVEHEDYREESEKIIRELVEDDPTLIETHSWPEILKMGETK
jgi:hypothetical protein